MLSWVAALVLASSPRAHPGPQGVFLHGPPAPERPELAGDWLVARYGVRTDTSWRGRRFDAPHGGWLLVLRETYRGHPIAGSRLAIRVGPDGRTRQLVGTGLSRALTLNAADAWVEGASLWWPTEAGLVPARVEEGEIAWTPTGASASRRYVHAGDGRVLATESAVDEVVVPITGWPENPVTTPELMVYDTELSDFDAILLEDAVFRVLQCNWDEGSEGCEPIFSPIAAQPDGFPDQPPPVADEQAHRDPTDPYAPLQFMQWAGRFEAKLAQWGWDPNPWDGELDCSWQGTDDPSDCRVIVYTNVMAQDEMGVFPFSSAFYRKKGEIFMGQGINADTSFDGDIVIHEMGHHVTWSFGSPEPTEMEADVARHYTDINGVNEASSDFFAWMMGNNDRIYDYYSAIEPGNYIDHRIRDVSFPFRCPQNVVGEVHMDGRIWVSALIDGYKALEAEGLSDRDAYASMYLRALGAIRHIPREQPHQMPQMREILLDEVGLSFGDVGRDILTDILDERGIGVCDYVIDIRDEPSITGDEDPADPMDARFVVFKSHNPAADPQVILDNPFAPPLQHRITLGEDEGGVRLTFLPNQWRPARPVDEVALQVAALVKAGSEPVSFTRDPETSLSVNDAELRFESSPSDGLVELVVDGLEPGETYTIALVSLTPIQGDKLMMEQMRWELLDAPPSSEEGGEGGEAGETGESGGAGTGEGGGCGCGTSGSVPSAAVLPLLVAFWRRGRRD